MKALGYLTAIAGVLSAFSCSPVAGNNQPQTTDPASFFQINNGTKTEISFASVRTNLGGLSYLYLYQSPLTYNEGGPIGTATGHFIGLIFKPVDFFDHSGSYVKDGTPLDAGEYQSFWVAWYPGDGGAGTMVSDASSGTVTIVQNGSTLQLHATSIPGSGGTITVSYEGPLTIY